MKPGWNWFSQTWWLPEAHSKQRPQPETKGTVTRSPSFQRVDAAADRGDRAGELVAGHMRQADVGIVPHPAVPVAAAEPGRLDLDDDAFGRGRRIGHGADAGVSPNASKTTALITITSFDSVGRPATSMARARCDYCHDPVTGANRGRAAQGWT